MRTVPQPPLRALGARPSEHPTSPQWRDGCFRNRRITRTVEPAAARSLARDAVTRRGIGRPSRPVPLSPTDLAFLDGDLAVTWFGHSSVLVEIGGRRVLTDPVWGARVSPFAWAGPRRMHPAPVPLEALPTVDAVVISHDHYDHLDRSTIEWLAHHRGPQFLVPLGVASHLHRWGVAPELVTELDWDDEHHLGDLTFTCAEAQHFSGRWMNNDRTLWCSWSIAHDDRRVWFGGDTGTFDGLASIGADLGPFDLTLMPVGAYDPRWADVHMDPEEAVAAHRALRGRSLLPIHWATFDLAFHPWAEPVDRLVAAAGDADDLHLLLPRPGERLRHDAATKPWW